MSPERGKQTYTLSTAALVREMDDGAVILDLDRGTYFGLDPVGTRIWQLLGQGNCLDEIASRILDEYEVDRKTVEQDLEKLVADLEERGLVRKA